MSHPVARWQIITGDPERHAAFYRNVFDWATSSDNAINYLQATTGKAESPDGGFWPAPPGAPCCVQLFMEVDDVEAVLTRATTHGAQVVMPAQHLPEGEVMALLRDPEGLPFGIFSSAKS